VKRLGGEKRIEVKVKVDGSEFNATLSEFLVHSAIVHSTIVHSIIVHSTIVHSTIVNF